MRQTDCEHYGSSAIAQILDDVTALLSIPFIIGVLILIGIGYLVDRLKREIKSEDIG